MDSYLSANRVFALFPHLPKSFNKFVNQAKSIKEMPGTLNTVLIIDNMYVLRTKKIKPYDFDDIGSCANFKKAVEHIDSHGFHFHPHFLLLEETRDRSGQQTEFLLYEKVPGKTLNMLIPELSTKDIRAIAGQAAKLLHRLHQIPAPGYGLFEGTQFGSWQDFILHWIDHQSFYIGKKGLLTNKEITRVKTIFSSNRSLLALANPSTIHLDYSPRNMLIDDDCNIKCILDWDNCRGGDPLVDFSYSLKRAFKEDAYAVFRKQFNNVYVTLSGSGNRETFDKKINLYALYYAYKLLPVHSVHLSDPFENVDQLRKNVRYLLRLRW